MFTCCTKRRFCLTAIADLSSRNQSPVFARHRYNLRILCNDCRSPSIWLPVLHLRKVVCDLNNNNDARKKSGSEPRVKYFVVVSSGVRDRRFITNIRKRRSTALLSKITILSESSVSNFAFQSFCN